MAPDAGAAPSSAGPSDVDPGTSSRPPGVAEVIAGGPASADWLAGW